MLFNKKRDDHAEQNEDEEIKPIDFAWYLFHGMNDLGFNKEELGHMRFGEFHDLWEIFKYDYNFKKKNLLYEEKKEKVSILSL